MRFQQARDEDIGLSVIVLQELLVGAHLSGVPSAALRIEALAGRAQMIPFDQVSARYCAAIEAGLIKTGQRIGVRDAQIAATALCHNWVLVTHNTSEFERISGLRVEDWQA